MEAVVFVLSFQLLKVSAVVEPMFNMETLGKWLFFFFRKTDESNAI